MTAVEVTQEDWERLVAEPGPTGSHILCAWLAVKRLRAGLTSDEQAEANSLTHVLNDYARHRLAATQPPAPGLDEATVKRVARAIYCAENGMADTGPDNAHLNYWFNDPDDRDKGAVDEYRDMARAAILALAATQPAPSSDAYGNDPEEPAFGSGMNAYEFAGHVEAAQPEPERQAGEDAFIATFGIRKDKKRIDSLSELLRLINGGAQIASIELAPRPTGGEKL